MNLSTATKYSARDSATAALRKVGVTKSDYDDFIARRDGVFYCDIEGAKAFVAKSAAAAVAASATMAAVAAEIEAVNKPAKKEAAKTEGRVSNSSIIRAAVLDGLTNQQIWDKFGPAGSKMLGENQHHYGAWYRCELRRKGHAV